MTSLFRQPDGRSSPATPGPQGGRRRTVTRQGAITVESPEDWVFKESVTLLAPSGRANLIVSSEPLPDGMDSAAYAATQTDLLSTQFDGYQEIAFYPLAVPGVRGEMFFHEFTWQPSGDDPVAQMQIYGVGPDGRGVTATATALAEDFAEHRDVLFRAMRSIVYAGRSPSPLTTASP